VDSALEDADQRDLAQAPDELVSVRLTLGNKLQRVCNGGKSAQLGRPKPLTHLIGHRHR